MQTVKLITFDATNTLLKFRIPAWQYYCIIGRDYGFTGNEDTLRTQMKESFIKMNAMHPNFGKSNITWQIWWKELVKQTFQGQLPANANIESIAEKLIDEYRTTKCWTIADNAKTLLNNLKRKGVCVGVISNFDPRLHDILHNVGLFNYFDFILTSYEVGYSKPDRRIFDQAIKMYKNTDLFIPFNPFNPLQCLHVGDDLEKDYSGARNAGWHALLIGEAKGNHARPVKEHVFKNITDLMLAIEQERVKL